MRLRAVCVPALLGLAFAVPAARGDIPPPVPPAKQLPIRIEVDGNAKQSKLLVPQRAVTEWRGGRGPVPEPPPTSSPPKGALGVERDAVGDAGPSDRHLIVAGLALALSVGFGGFWLVRRNGRASARGLVLLVAAGGALLVGGFVWANAAPAPFRKAPDERPALFEGEVRLEVVPIGGGADQVRLILSKADAEKLGAR
jgi:hypothetical protein